MPAFNWTSKPRTSVHRGAQAPQQRPQRRAQAQAPATSRRSFDLVALSSTALAARGQAEQSVSAESVAHECRPSTTESAYGERGQSDFAAHAGMAAASDYHDEREGSNHRLANVSHTGVRLDSNAPPEVGLGAPVPHLSTLALGTLGRESPLGARRHYSTVASSSSSTAVLHQLHNVHADGVEHGEYLADLDFLYGAAEHGTAPRSRMAAAPAFSTTSMRFPQGPRSIEELTPSESVHSRAQAAWLDDTAIGWGVYDTEMRTSSADRLARPAAALRHRLEQYGIEEAPRTASGNPSFHPILRPGGASWNGMDDGNDSPGRLDACVAAPRSVHAREAHTVPFGDRAPRVELADGRAFTPQHAPQPPQHMVLTNASLESFRTSLLHPKPRLATDERARSQPTDRVSLRPTPPHCGPRQPDEMHEPQEMEMEGGEHGCPWRSHVETSVEHQCGQEQCGRARGRADRSSSGLHWPLAGAGAELDARDEVATASEEHEDASLRARQLVRRPPRAEARADAPASSRCEVEERGAARTQCEPPSRGGLAVGAADGAPRAASTQASGQASPPLHGLAPHLHSATHAKTMRDMYIDAEYGSFMAADDSAVDPAVRDAMPSAAL